MPQVRKLLHADTSDKRALHMIDRSFRALQEQLSMIDAAFDGAPSASSSPKPSINRLEPLITRNAQLLCDKLQEYAGSGRPASLSMAFNCSTTDIVAEYAFLKRYRFFGDTQFPNPLLRAVQDVLLGHSVCQTRALGSYRLLI